MHDFTDRTQQSTSTSLPPTTIYSDNTSAIKWLKNKSHHNNTKHIIGTLTLKIREQVMEFDMLKVEPVRTELQVADVLSKALGSISHWKHMHVLLRLPDPEAGKDLKNRRAGTEVDS